jgi:acetyl esterase/lipase
VSRLPVVRTVVALALVVLATVCGERGGAAADDGGVRSWLGVPFTPPIACGLSGTCRLRMDVFAPARPGRWPVVVMLPGGPAPPTAYRSLDGVARGIAALGAVAIATAWREGVADGGGYPRSFQDVACAIGVARHVAPRYGGRPDRVVLAGHSLGGWAAAVVALSRRAYSPPSGGCERTAGALRPDALVTVSGAVHWAQAGYSDDWLEAFFGGTREERPGAWEASDPFSIVTRRADAHAVPVTVIGGGRDVVVPESIGKAFATQLRASGYRVRLVLVPGADHGGIGRTNAAKQAILGATRAAGSS